MSGISETVVNVCQRLEALNGWQRSWCVVVLIWFLGCAALTGYILPTDPSEVDTSIPAPTYRGEYVFSGENLCSKWKPEQGSDDERRCLEIEREFAPGGWIEERQWQIALKQARALAELKAAQLSTIEKSLALWLIPSIGLYLLGMGISWLKKGFK